MSLNRHVSPTIIIFRISLDFNYFLLGGRIGERVWQGESTLECPYDCTHNQVFHLLAFQPHPCLLSKSLQALGTDQ